MSLTDREQLADFRNALTHAYADLIPEETWRRLAQGLPAMAEFASQIAQR